MNVLREAAKIVAHSQRLSKHGYGGQCIIEVVCEASAGSDVFDALRVLHHRVSHRPFVDALDIVSWWNETLPDIDSIVKTLVRT